MYVIPLTADPNQVFRCTIPIDGGNRTLSIGLRYNAVAQYWSMSVTDPGTGKTLIDSLPILTGIYPAANLLEQYSYLSIGSVTVVKTAAASNTENPDDKTLGSEFVLVWTDTL